MIILAILTDIALAPVARRLKIDTAYRVLARRVEISKLTSQERRAERAALQFQ